MIVSEKITQLNKENMPSLIVLTGEDRGQFQHAKEQLLGQIGFDSSDLGYAYFDVSESEYDQIELDLVSLPFFSNEKIVILDYFVDVTTEKKRYLTDEELKRFEQYLEHPNETTRLVIFAAGKLDSKRRLVKLLKRDGELLEANPLKEVELRSFFFKKAQEEGLELTQEVFDQLLFQSNSDYSELTKNLVFLKAYQPVGVITLETIKQAIPKTLQDNLFDLTQFLLRKQVDKARQLVRDLRLQGEDEIKLTAVLLTQFRMFLQVRLLQEQGRSEQQMVSDLSALLGRTVNPYQVKFALRDSRTVSIPFLQSVVCLLIELDFQMKSGVYDKDYLFDIALLRMAVSSFFSQKS